MRCGRQAGVVAKYPQRAARVPSLAQGLDHRLQRRRDRFVLEVTIGDEGIVGGHVGVSQCARQLIRRCHQRGIDFKLQNFHATFRAGQLHGYAMSHHHPMFSKFAFDIDTENLTGRKCPRRIINGLRPSPAPLPL